MNTLNVRIVRLPAMRVISAYGFGTSPENEAAAKMEAFLQEKGLLADYGSKIQHYGFNNPSPSCGSPNYGYEIWATVPESVEPSGDLQVVQFEGGLYAMTRFQNLERIGEVWSQLVQWREASVYREACNQCLEHLLNPLERDVSKYDFELLLPVKEN